MRQRDYGWRKPTDTVDLCWWEHMDSGPTVRDPARVPLRPSTYVLQLVLFVRLLAVRLEPIPRI